MDTQSEAHTRRPTAGRSSRLLPPAGSWRAAFWQHPIAFWPLWWLFRHQKNLNQVGIGHRSAPGSFLFPANPHWPAYYYLPPVNHTRSHPHYLSPLYLPVRPHRSPQVPPGCSAAAPTCVWGWAAPARGHLGCPHGPPRAAQQAAPPHSRAAAPAAAARRRRHGTPGSPPAPPPAPP